MTVDRLDRFPLSPGVILCIGVGGFVDGIVLHQILQWHPCLPALDTRPITCET